MTTTLHFSGLNTDPLFLIHLASDSRYRVYPQVSLLPCRLDSRQVGLVLFNTHPLGNTNQFHLFQRIPRFRIYLGTRNCLVSCLDFHLLLKPS